MTVIIIYWTNTLITLILLLTLLISLTLCTHFQIKKIPIPLKNFSFPIQNSLYWVAFPLFIPTDFPLYLVFCTQEMSTDLQPNIPGVSKPRRAPTFTLQTCKSSNLLSRWFNCWVRVWPGHQLTLVLACTSPSIFTLKSRFHLPGLVYQFFSISKIHLWQNFMTECPFWAQLMIICKSAFRILSKYVINSFLSD